MPYVIKSGPKKGQRDYTKERLLETAERKKKRSMRNKARHEMQLKVGDSRHVDHIDNNALNNSKKNLRVVSAKTNLTKEAKRKKLNG